MSSIFRYEGFLLSFPTTLGASQVLRTAHIFLLCHTLTLARPVTEAIYMTRILTEVILRVCVFRVYYYCTSRNSRPFLASKFTMPPKVNWKALTFNRRGNRGSDPTVPGIPSSRRKKKHIIVDSLKMSLQFLFESSDACPPLKSAVGAMQHILSVVEVRWL